MAKSIGRHLFRSADQNKRLLGSGPANSVAAYVFRNLMASAFIVLVVVLDCLPAEAAQLDENAFAFGARGDFQETYNCPTGQFLTGLYGRTGSWIDQVGLVCARFVQPSYSAGSQVKQPPRGGNGGGPNEQVCDADSAIRTAYVRLTNDMKRVAYIKFSCFRPRDGSFAGGRLFGGPDPGAPSDRLTPIGPFLGHDPNSLEDDCQGSEYATGLAVNYGRDVNAAGLICNKFDSEASASPFRLPSNVILNALPGAPSNKSTSAHRVKIIHTNPSVPPSAPAPSNQTPSPNTPPPSAPDGGTTSPNTPTSTAQDVLSGLWQGKVAYDFQQNGSSFTWWCQSLQESATGTIDGDSLTVSWTGPNGNGGMNGRIVGRDSDGRAARIRWDNGQLWLRAN